MADVDRAGAPPPSPCGEGGCLADYVIKQPFLERTKREELDALAARRYRVRTWATEYNAHRAITALSTSAEVGAARLRSLPPGYWEYATQFERDVRRQADTNQLLDQLHAIQEADKKQAQAIVRQQQRQQAANRVAGQTLRRAGASTGPGSTADLLGIIGTELNIELYERKRAAAQRQRILRVGRRGALAQPSASGSAVPGRSGARSTRPLASPVIAGQPAAPTAAKKSVGTDEPAVAKKVVSSESAKSKAARAVLASSPSLPKTRTSSAKATPASFLTFGSFSTPANPFPTLPRQVTRQVARGAPARPRSTSPTRSPELTRLQQPVLTSQYQCQCEKPPKRRKRAGCTNPLISRDVRDGVITIKRKLQCPPSR